MANGDILRRDFLKATGASVAAGNLAAAGQNRPSKMIGIQAGAVSFVDEGVERADEARAHRLEGEVPLAVPVRVRDDVVHGVVTTPA